MTRKLLLKFALFTIIALAGLTWGTQTKASALMCAVLAPAVNVSSPPKNTDCLSGQDYTKALSSLSSGSSSDALKSQFITKMTAFESGQHLQKVGATYIENLITGTSNMSWQDRVNSQDIKLQIGNYGYTTNTAYDPISDSVRTYTDNPNTQPTLEFIVGGVVKLAIKLDCGNPVGDLPPIPGPPVIRGYKVDNTGSIYGPYSLDTISATGGIPDNNEPFNITVQDGSVTVADADATAGWKVVGSTYTACNTANISSNNCPLVSPSDATLTTTTPNFVSGTTRIITAKSGYVYDMRWVYQKVQPAIIKGFKIDSSNSTSGPYSGDTIRATSLSGTVPDSNNPFSLTAQAGPVSITPDNSISNWIVTGYTICNNTTNPLTCNNSSSPTATTPNPPGLIAGTTANITVNAGNTYYMRWIYSKGIPPSPPGNTCPSLPNPNVVVVLPDQTPYPRTAPPPATTSPNSWYYQYTPSNSTKVTNVQDISSGGNRLLSMLNLKSQSYQQAVVDYSPFVSGYPYDNNQASVSYTSSYTVTPYVSSSTPSSYTCADGSIPNSSHVCTSTITIGGLHTNPVGIAKTTTTYCTSGGTWNGSTTSPSCGTYKSPTPTSYTYSCPSGQTLSGSGSSSVCKTSYPAVDHWTCRNSTATWNNGKTCLSVNRIHHYVCPNGGNLVSTSCVVTYPAIASPAYGQIPYPISSTTTTTYTCPAPYTSGGGTTNICSYNDTQTIYNYSPAIAWYNYIKQPSSTALNSSTANGLAMSACYARGFNVTAVNANSANVSLNNYENPTIATAGGYTASVKFSYTNVAPTQGLRQPMKANLTYTYKFSVGCTGNVAFTITGGYSPSGPSPYPITSGNSCGVSVPPLAPGGTVCATYSVSPTGLTTDSSGNVIAANGGTVSSGPQCSGPVVNEPYFKVFGGDVSAGSAFATTSSSGASTCSSNNTGAGVYGWNTAADPVYGQHYAGSGAQYAVTSPNVIMGVASNQNNSNALPSAGAKPNPLGLSFSNTVNNTATIGQFGGKLTANCITDFYSSKPTTGTVDISGTQNLNGLDGKKMYTMSDGSIIKQSNITPGKHITIYATGNIFIENDITFTGNYPTIDQIPSLILIVKGNIYISNNVKNLYGIFIAQPTTSSNTDGYIYDCAAGAGLFVSPNSIYSGCGNQLVVNGSFIANKVSLMRTGITTGSPISSSLRGSITNETNAVTNKNPAEIFNYGPAFWMNLSLPQSTSTGTSSAGYDSIISLPPIL